MIYLLQNLNDKDEEIVFDNREELLNYIKENDFYGKIYEYDDKEYMEYTNDLSDELPTILDEYDTESLEDM